MDNAIKQAKVFFEILWGVADHGFLTMCAINSGRVKSKSFDLADNNTPINGARYSAFASKRGWDSYHTLGLLNDTPSKGRGIELDVAAIPGLWMDIDIKTGNHAKIELPDSKQNVFDFLNWKS